MNMFSYKGIDRSTNYFEGWYVRLIDEKNNLSYSVIFGITLYEKDPHSFIQIVNNQTEKSDYIRFQVNDFSYGNYQIKIKDNLISPYRIQLNLKDLNIDLEVNDFTYLDRNKLIPSAMSIFQYLPLCTKYEIIYLKGKAKGKVIERDQEYNFNGLSYMEKNWGDKFPSKWIWAETNHFENLDASLVFVYTELTCFNIPTFLCILNIKGIEYRFATYNCASIDILKIDSDTIMINLTKCDLILNLKINYNEEQPIVVPIKNGRMRKIIGHSLNSTLTLSLLQNDIVIYQGDAYDVGCENTFINN